MTCAVVFAYHNVGVRCLKVLLAHGVNVALVVTHEDHPHEEIWFDSVATVANEEGLALLKPDEANTPEMMQHLRALQPDFLFSFYYRKMLAPELLAIPRRGALNLHGSLLPKYRGRAPVNWAVLHGETETGATLHYMTVKPDAGDIVAQTAVPILPNDTASEVFDKVTVAAELTLYRVLPELLAGHAPRIAQNLQQGSYFAGRRPEDGWIDWQWPAWRIHHLVRAVAPPYPGAFTTIQGQPARILRTRVVMEKSASSWSQSQLAGKEPVLECVDGQIFAHCADGGLLRILALEIAGKPATCATLQQMQSTRGV